MKWSKIREHEKEIVSITIMASILPFILISGGIMTIGYLFPTWFPFDQTNLLMLSLLLGALASPTAPAATLAVIHQYHAKGKVTDTILGVAALDDVLGVLIFSLTIAFVLIVAQETFEFSNSPLINAVFHIGAAIMIGTVLGLALDPIANWIEVRGEGQWVVIIFSLIIFAAGVCELFDLDILLCAITMGIVVVNHSKHHQVIFELLERYTEDLIFLFFFLLSGLHLDLSVVPAALGLTLIFVFFRTAGKYMGAYWGARLVKADHSIQKYTAGGLLPQAGIVIGLVLSIYQHPPFMAISEVLLATIMGATLIHELIGPIAAKFSLTKTGEIKV